MSEGDEKLERSSDGGTDIFNSVAMLKSLTEATISTVYLRIGLGSDLVGVKLLGAVFSILLQLAALKRGHEAENITTYPRDKPT